MFTPSAVVAMPTRSSASRVVIRETRHEKGVWRTLFGVLGLVAVAVIVSLQPYLSAQDITAPFMAFSLAFGVVVFGVAALGSWRRAEEVEAVEIQNGRLQLVVSFYQKPLFDAPLEIAQVHRFVLPKNGGMKLFLRDGERAIEVGADMSGEEREALAQRLDLLVAPYKPAPLT